MTEYLETTVDKFIFRVAQDRLYSTAGVWVALAGERVRIGLSDFVQQRSGDIAFVDVQPVGTALKAEEEVATIETIKVDVSLPSPVAGKVAAINPALDTGPESINQDPYGEGWLCEIEPADWDSDRKRLLDATGYFARMKQEAEDEAKK
jgi:glycine cleavage system H protein